MRLRHKWVMVTAMWLILSAVAGHTEELTLSAAVIALERQGHTIIYSNRTVNPNQSLQLKEHSLLAFRQALMELGLTLQSRREGVWIILRQPASQTNPESKVEQVSPLSRVESVIVTGSRHHFPNIGHGSSAHSFIQRDLQQTPALGSDAIRAVQQLPGMSSLGVSAKPRIRGGLQDELLVIRDNVELLEPFHLADYHSAYSGIDFHTVESLDVYTGGFPARYGNRMSGVMDIQSQGFDRKYNTDLGVSSFANSLSHRHKFGTNDSALWSLTARRGDLSDLTDYLQSRSGSPRYSDVTTRLELSLPADVTLQLGGAFGEDDIRFNDEEETASSKVDTHLWWLSLFWDYSTAISANATLSWVEVQRRKTLNSGEDEDKGGFLDHRQDVSRLALRNDWRATWPSALLEFGWQAQYERARYTHLSEIDRGELAEIVETQRLVERNLKTKPRGWSLGAYTQLEYAPSPRLVVQPSLRVDYQNYYLDRGGDTQLSPRLGLSWQLTNNIQGRLGLGRFYQPEGIGELQVLDGLTQFFEAQHVDQMAAALEWQTANTELLLELYSKWYDNPKPRFENIFNPYVLLPEMEPDRALLKPDKAEVVGAEVLLRHRFSNSFRVQMSYSFMDPRDRIENQWIDRRWSQRHSVNGGLFWQQGSFSASVAISWHSGWLSTRLPDFVPFGVSYPVNAILNNTELDDYYSLDISLRKYWEFSGARLEIYADISNLTDRINMAGIDFDIEEADEGFEISPDFETVLGRVPSVGIRVSF